MPRERNKTRRRKKNPKSKKRKKMWEWVDSLIDQHLFKANFGNKEFMFKSLLNERIQNKL